jgi:hypothetical protein
MGVRSGQFVEALAPRLVRSRLSAMTKWTAIQTIVSPKMISAHGDDVTK